MILKSTLDDNNIISGKKGGEFNNIHKLMLLENTQFELEFEHISTF